MTDETENCPHCDEDISDVVSGLKSALAGARNDRTEAKRKLKEIEADGVTREEYDARMTELDEAKAEIERLKPFEDLWRAADKKSKDLSRTLSEHAKKKRGPRVKR